jgi:hypothetical protein
MCQSHFQPSNSESAYPIGCELQFPGKLHDLMTYVENEGCFDVISWVNHGLAIKVHDRKKLVELLPQFFSQSKYRSFERQLNMWKFERIFDGKDRGAFRHPYFIRGQKSLCRRMTRQNFQSDSLARQKATLKEQFQLVHFSLANQSVLKGSFDSRSEKLPAPLCSLNDTQDGSKVSAKPLTIEYSYTSKDSQHDREEKSYFQDGDLMTFAGRHFYYVDEESSSKPESMLHKSLECKSNSYLAEMTPSSLLSLLQSTDQYELALQTNRASHFLDNLTKDFSLSQSATIVLPDVETWLRDEL